MIKGIVYPKMIIHSLSTHQHADGGVGEELSPQNTSEVSGVNSVAAESNTTEDIMDLSSDVTKQEKK